jgi:hypothetical protein
MSTKTTEGEVNDFPFLSNEIKAPYENMDRPLDTADAPGRADAELAEEELPRPLSDGPWASSGPK